ncbi:MAG: hydrogenase 4 subunit B, partial [Aquamicrobium sp.]|nr:hydrogenase 4 subunit B [Aquamicrobium sp.]
FIALSASLSAFLVHRLASRRLRRAPAWDCGFPVASPAAQYSAGGFAQPFRRIFGPAVFSAREAVDMPAPGDMRPARLTVSMGDPVWDRLYAPVASGIDAVAGRLNRLQFLTIRRYLSLVFAFLVALLLVLALWA